MKVKRCELFCGRPAITSIAGVALCAECSELTRAIQADAERTRLERKETAA